MRNSRLITLLLLAGFATFICLYRGSSPEDGITVGLLAVSALLLELSSIRLPHFGFLSSSFACVYCMAMIPEAGARAACLTVWVGLCCRTLIRPRTPVLTGLRELAADAAPALCALATATILAPYSQAGSGGFPMGLERALGSLLVYLLLGHWAAGFVIHEMTSLPPTIWRKISGALNIQIRASAVCGPTMVLLATVSRWHTLWLAPLFFGLYLLSWDRLEEVRSVRGREKRVKQDLTETESQLRVTERTLAGTAQEKNLLERCARTFAEKHTTAETVAAVAHLLKRLVRPTSLSIFLQQDGVLTSAHQEGPEAQRELAEQGWREAAPVYTPDSVAVACPLYQSGVVTVTCPSKITEQQLRSIAIVVSQAVLGLRGSRHYDELQLSLAQTESSNQRLTLWNERLYQMLVGSRAMTRTFEVADVLASLEQLLSGLIPFEWGQLTLRGESYALKTCPNMEAGLSVAQAVQARKQTLLLSRQDDSGAPTLGPGQNSLLAVPLENENEVLGAIVLASPAVEAYSLEQSQLLGMLALHTAVVLTNCALHEETVAAQAHLVQSSKMAAVGQLAAGVAHEINTPLAAVLLGLQAAQRNLEKGRPEKAATKIEQSILGANNAKEIVTKLLFYSRKGNLDKEPVDLNKVVTDTLNFLGQQLKDSKVELQHSEGKIDAVRGNHNELQQVLINLVINARDAVLEEGAAEKRLFVETLTEDRRAVIRVRDTGPGMTSEQAAKVFEPFFTTKPAEKGTGLGLYISRQIVEQHKGQLSVETAPGEGAVFTVTLPYLA